MAVASAGPYASLHFAPDKQPHQQPTTLFFTGRMAFLPPNQQRQSTEGYWQPRNICLITVMFSFNGFAFTAKSNTK